MCVCVCAQFTSTVMSAPLPSNSVIAADTLRDLDLSSWSVVIHGGSRGQPLHQV